MNKEVIETSVAPGPIGTYSQAIRVGNHVYLSGQIALDANSMEMVNEDVRDEIQQIFRNLAAICTEAGGSMGEVVKLTVYVTHLQHAALVNELMSEFFSEPYPVRTMVEVSKLPKDAQVEIDAIMVLV